MTARLYVSIDRSGLTPRYIASPHMHPGAEEWIPRDAVRVKPLEWIASGRDAFDALGPERVHYRVWPTVTMGHTSFGLSGDTCGYFPTVEAAKAAAQADYEARIMSALAALPAGAQEEEA